MTASFVLGNFIDTFGGDSNPLYQSKLDLAFVSFYCQGQKGSSEYFQMSCWGSRAIKVKQSGSETIVHTCQTQVRNLINHPSLQQIKHKIQTRFILPQIIPIALFENYYYG